MRLWLSFWLCQAARLRQADVENDQHRLACLRQDNLELLSIDSDPEELAQLKKRNLAPHGFDCRGCVGFMHRPVTSLTSIPALKR